WAATTLSPYPCSTSQALLRALMFARWWIPASCPSSTQASLTVKPVLGKLARESLGHRSLALPRPWPSWVRRDGRRRQHECCQRETGSGGHWRERPDTESGTPVHPGPIRHGTGAFRTLGRDSGRGLEPIGGPRHGATSRVHLAALGVGHQRGDARAHGLRRG